MTEMSGIWVTNFLLLEGRKDEEEAAVEVVEIEPTESVEISDGTSRREELLLLRLLLRAPRNTLDVNLVMME